MALLVLCSLVLMAGALVHSQIPSSSSVPGQFQGGQFYPSPPEAYGPYQSSPFHVSPPHLHHYTRTHHASSTTPPPENLGDFRIVCIYNKNQFYNLGFRPSQVDPFLCTHINYEFAVLDAKTYEMVCGEKDIDIDEGLYAEAVNLMKKNPNLKVMISLGGWEDSTRKYSDLVDSAARVDHFIEKAVHFLREHGFSGLDIAWEYPNCWQGALGVSPKDKKNFAEFLEKLRNRFEKENLILSISAGAIKKEILAAYDGPTISRTVHYVNVMTYDMHGPWESKTGSHSQFERRQGDSDPYSNSKAAIEVWTSMGVDRKKLNLGLPTYAKTYTLTDPNDKGYGAPTKGPGKPGPLSQQAGYLCYSEICQFLNAGNWTEGEDKAAGFFAYSNSGDQWASYDPPMMVVRKAKYVVESQMGGILIKDLSCDDHMGNCFHLPFPLIKMLRLEMVSKIRKLGLAPNAG